jgi:DNA integrity scanning protein DisA with diadenylate cyclase activity
VGYFCKKYKEAYGVDYPWKFNNPSPKKCFEVWQMNTLVAKLSANPKLLKDYIDWAFDNLVPKAKRKLTSISFMTKDEVLNPYKVNVLLGDKKSLNVDRSTPLPDKYQQVFRDCQVHAHTYGDVAFLSQMDPIAENVATALDHIELLGFDMEILKRIV